MALGRKKNGLVRFKKSN